MRRGRENKIGPLGCSSTEITSRNIHSAILTSANHTAGMERHIIFHSVEVKQRNHHWFLLWEQGTLRRGGSEASRAHFSLSELRTHLSDVISCLELHISAFRGTAHMESLVQTLPVSSLFLKNSRQQIPHS